MFDWITDDIVLEYFLRNFYLRYPELVGKVDIGYGDAAKKVNIQSADRSKFFQKGEILNSKDVIKKTFLKDEVAFFFGKQDQDIVSFENGNATIHQDIIASTFYLLSGYDELARGNFDKYDRVAYEGGIVDQGNFITIPLVNYYFEILKDALEKCYNMSIKPKIDFSLVLSHDIDMIYSGWKMLTKQYIKSGKFWKIPKVILNRIFNGDILYNFSLMQQIEKNYDAYSTYFFLPSIAQFRDTKNADYDAGAYKLQKVMIALGKKGHEIGVHGSFGTSTSAKQLLDETGKLKGDIIGNRFHYLMYDNNKSIKSLECSKLSYDTSLGFAEHIGFRRGICTPFFLMDFDSKKISSCIELPLIVMDASLAFDKYMGVSPEASYDAICELWNIVKKFDGVFTVLWHNNMFNDELYPGWRNLYERILEKANKEEVSIRLGRDIVQDLLSRNN